MSEEETEISKKNRLIYDLYRELLYIFQEVRGYFVVERDKDITFEEFIESYGNPPGNKFLPLDINKLTLVLYYKKTNKYVYVCFADRKFDHTKKPHLTRINTIFDNAKRTHKYIFVFDTTIHGRGNYAKGKLKMRNLFTKKIRKIMSDKSKVLREGVHVPLEVIFINEIRPMHTTVNRQKKRKRDWIPESPNTKRRKFENQIEVFITRNEKDKIQKTFHCVHKKDLQTILHTDMLCKAIGARAGNIISVVESNETGGRSKSYKLVI
jgi:DNA-directed RNA polymerase subunit H (RpoH/RPB5)